MIECKSRLKRTIFNSLKQNKDDKIIEITLDKFPMDQIGVIKDVHKYD